MSRKERGKFRASSTKGEPAELKVLLNSSKPHIVKDAIKKVIHNMTVGRDMASLFPDVIKSMQTDNVEIKKLIYLFIMNYARHQPEQAIMIVNSFQRDCDDANPLIRALAIRTMGCIRVEKITEHLCEPLAKAIKDKDPYVRKTAAVCISKLFSINADLTVESGFIDQLRALIADGNPMVVSNAVASLAEIAEVSEKDVFRITSQILGKLLVAINECTEWGQVFILDCLSKYEPSAKEARDIVERVAPRLKHANSAVAMSAVKVIMKYLDVLEDKDLKEKLITEKLPPPLITLLNQQQPEIQYVALRNINLIVQKESNVLKNAIKHFFCKYNDPIYVKMEKLDLMIQLSAKQNIASVLLEFKQYAREVDVEFVRKAVSAIGRCAIKIEAAAEQCVKVLLELIETKVNYVVQESIVVIRDIFRKYPNKYESVIAKLCENLDSLDEPKAKSAMVWIIGEYAHRIDNSPDILESFVETFQEETDEVQLSILTATVKTFLKLPDETKHIVTQVLDLATEQTDNPDVRDRGYVYWRLLSSNPDVAQSVVWAKKPVISDQTFQHDPALLDVLIRNLATMASIYHKPPEFFTAGGKSSIVLKKTTTVSRRKPAKPVSDSDTSSSSGDSSDSDSDSSDDTARKGPAVQNDTPKAKDEDDSASSDSSASDSDEDDGAPVTRRVVLPAAQGKGLEVKLGWRRKGKRLWMDLVFDNKCGQPLSKFAMAFNKNYLGLTPAGPVKPGVIPPGGSESCMVPMNTGGVVVEGPEPNLMHVALKTQLGIFYFKDTLPAFLAFHEDGKLEATAFLQQWDRIPERTEQSGQFSSTYTQLSAIKDRLASHNVFYITNRTIPDRGLVIYASFRFKEVGQLCELAMKDGTFSVVVRSTDATLASVALKGLQDLLTS